ncbi:Lrp/AsnC family transcriptional regulator [Pseudotabrizicola sp. 4114]|uniref:Lrp/AsnC family transcriptional regulator n=1 Tax=Pseudotabrizicola sp. 4114 TaxID=2817731 RepID=UPI0028618BEA|nr:DNA-binding Lrp family transcriptional regulator [Pseudorhodobacter sp. 4114]
MSKNQKIDEKDRQIIRTLQRNGRMTNQDLAAAVNLSPTPCLRRIRLLEQSGVIKGYGVEIDSDMYGLPVTVFVRVSLDRHTEANVKQFEQAMSKIDAVLECYMMTGVSDYLLKVIVADLSDYETFVRKHLHPIGGIASIDSSFVYGVVKKSGVFPMIG